MREDTAFIALGAVLTLCLIVLMIAVTWRLCVEVWP